MYSYIYIYILHFKDFATPQRARVDAIHPASKPPSPSPNQQTSNSLELGNGFNRREVL